jgi:uncharacterized protein
VRFIQLERVGLAVVSNFKKTVYTVAVHDLIHRPGEMREFDMTFEVPENLGEGVIAVKAGSEMSVFVRFEGLHDGILASTEVSAIAEGECVRCLTEVTKQVEVTFQDVFAYSYDEAFDYQVHEDHIDLEPMIRDAVVLSLPFQPVCRRDCPGLDPVTGERLADQPDQEPQTAVDPRWAALAGFEASASSDDSSSTPKNLDNNA